MTLAAGFRLGPYEILSSLGAGGIGEVYKAMDTRLDRTVAVKVLPLHLSASPAGRGSTVSYGFSIDQRFVGYTSLGGVRMAHAVVSPKFQVVIPKVIRREVGLQSGQVLQIISKGGVITMVPDQPVERMRGYLKGMKTSALREKKDRS